MSVNVGCMPGCVIAVMMVIMMAGGRAETCCVMAVPFIGAQEDNKTGSSPGFVFMVA